MSALAAPSRSPKAPGAKGAATRARLLEAAAELLAEGGYAAASVAAVADRAGLSAGALYRHFPSKADLLCELFRELAEAELMAMHAAGDRTGGYVDRLDTVLETYAGHVLANPRLSWALVYEPVHPRLDAVRLEYRRRYRAEMAELIAAAIAAGELPEQDPELSAAAVVGAIAEALLNPTSPTGAAGNGDELVNVVISICRRAVGAAG